jgi:predicted HNH restriction endonuclease
MKKYWVIAPYDARRPKEWTRIWKYDLANNVISIGWSSCGDTSGLSHDEVLERIIKNYSHKRPQDNRVAARMLYDFFHSIEINDTIIARRGLKRVAAIGTVTQTAYHDPHQHFQPYGSRDQAFANHLNVKWSKDPRDIEYTGNVFRMDTVVEIEQERMVRLSLPIDHPISPECVYPDEVPSEKEYIEGAVTQKTVNAYERDPRARAACIARYGYECSVCSINFESVYGQIGSGFIHIHHKKPLSRCGGKYQLDPIQDLAPVCPNCHAMLHTQDPPLDINELQQLVRR